MKVLFLDIDGVLATCETFNHMAEVGVHHFCKFARGPVYQLNKVLEATGAEIVVSSSWRCDGPRWEALMEHFEGQGVARRPIGRTPDLRLGLSAKSKLQPQRGDEIKAWLGIDTTLRESGIYTSPTTDVESYAVIDDDCDMDAVKDRFVWVRNGSYRGGMNGAHAQQLIDLLGRKS
jgi:hypothetical protein